MAEYIVNDFSAGLISSDDAVGGRKTGLLRMDNVDLDINGAVRMTYGTTRQDSAFANTVHTIFTKFLGSTLYKYACDTAGAIFRNAVSIKTGGSTSRGAFGSAYDFVIACSGTKRIRDDGTTATDLGQTKPSAPTAALNGAGLLNALYEYIQINVYATGAYLARSAMSSSVKVTAANNKIQITAVAPTAPANEVWIFRRGGDLDQYYRVKRLTSSYTTPFDDNLTDITVIENGITANETALSVNSTDLPDDILEIVGPINNRLLYFTKNAVNFSEVNSPESYIPGQSMYFMGSATTSEIFQWARKIGQNIVLIGTSKEIYRLTGTMITQPDGTLDVYLKPLGVDAPPIAIDCDVYQNNVIYMSAYGWVVCSADGTLIPLCPPNIDFNYYGQTTYGVTGVPIYLLPAQRYSCCVVRNKLFARVPEFISGVTPPFQWRIDVYDFIRKYWRTMRYPSNNAPLMLTGSEVDTVYGFFDNDKYIKQIDSFNVYTFDNGPAAKQTINLTTPFYDCGLTRQRKDANCLKLRIYTGGDALTYKIYTNNDLNTIVQTGTINKSNFTEAVIDLAGILLDKNFQLNLSGQIADFKLTDISLQYEPRPEQTTFLRILHTNFGRAAKKRVRTWPFEIDTLGGTVTFTPNVDGIDKSVSTYQMNRKGTFLHYFNSDVFGLDYGGTFSSSTPFEFYKPLDPELVQMLPVAKKFDQVGPNELWRYGKIKCLEFHLMPEGGTTIPWTLYLQDSSVVSGNLTVTDVIEDVYILNIPKTVAGRILRIELGPTSFPFYRFAARAQVIKSGRDTDLEWIDLSNG